MDVIDKGLCFGEFALCCGVCGLEQHLGGVADRGNHDSGWAFGVCVCNDADYAME